MLLINGGRSQKFVTEYLTIMHMYYVWAINHYYYLLITAIQHRFTYLILQPNIFRPAIKNVLLLKDCNVVSTPRPYC